MCHYQRVHRHLGPLNSVHRHPSFPAPSARRLLLGCLPVLRYAWRYPCLFRRQAVLAESCVVAAQESCEWTRLVHPINTDDAQAAKPRGRSTRRIVDDSDEDDDDMSYVQTPVQCPADLRQQESHAEEGRSQAVRIGMPLEQITDLVEKFLRPKWS